MVAPKRWWIAPVVVLAVWLAGTAPGPALTPRPIPLNGIQDAAGLFSEQAVSKAREKIRLIKRRFGKDLVVQTFASPPDRYKGQKGREFAPQWAEKEFDDNRVDGVYILICKKPRLLEVAVGNVTRRKGVFTNENRNELVKVLLRKLRESSKAQRDGDEKKAQELRDQALLAGIEYVRQNMKPVPGAGAQVPNR